jgi:voltage-gated potassium channel
MGEATALRVALRSSLYKITVFLLAVLTVVIVVGALMYQIEGERNGFTSIPAAMYWAIVTVTTVGYGDISPHTVTGRIVASVLMVLGYGIIAVPTGIVSFEFARTATQTTPRPCPGCAYEFHDRDALHCKRCGASLC